MIERLLTTIWGDTLFLPWRHAPNTFICDSEFVSARNAESLLLTVLAMSNRANDEPAKSLLPYLWIILQFWVQCEACVFPIWQFHTVRSLLWQPGLFLFCQSLSVPYHLWRFLCVPLSYRVCKAKVTCRKYSYHHRRILLLHICIYLAKYFKE